MRKSQVRKAAFVLLLTYLALGAGSAESSVLCFGRDRHEAMEFGRVHSPCASRHDDSTMAGGSLDPHGNHHHGNSCVSCKGTPMVSLIVSLPADMFSPGDEKWHADALQPVMRAHELYAAAFQDSTGYGPSELPDITGIHTRSVVLLI